MGARFGGTDEIWTKLPVEVRAGIRAKGLHLWVIDANSVANATGMRGRINNRRSHDRVKVNQFAALGFHRGPRRILGAQHLFREPA